MTGLYAIGDIHGQKDMLDAALCRIEADGGRDARVVFLGDYSDRGPDVRGVIETLVQGRAEGRDWVFIKGNHDRFFELYLDPEGPRADPHLMIGYHWLHPDVGGIETVASYGLSVPERIRASEMAARLHEAVPESHKAFLRELKLSHRQDGYFFAHAGIRPGIPLDEQSAQDLLWIRKPFHEDRRDHGAVIVHGHTPVSEPQRYVNRINLDTGAGHGRKLTVAAFENGKVYHLTANGRVLLPVRD
ncbi:metallophosphoesterase family protein [Marivita sp. GX14005]|uniref:metallophosphoesterase family protein n=1 Tax=Marivita sp. GX14005 TaxID=2942276 RepID=UPI0020188E1B|nr:metallophosphoesterase family protein [Marivita sp. GX14005]MCL3881524.1 serine/threonine protein phosphatase [Marivita sp. GX14005]